MFCLYQTPQKELKQTTVITYENMHNIMTLVLNHLIENVLTNTNYKLPLNYYHRHGRSTICSLINSAKAHATGTWRRVPQGMPLGTASPIRPLRPCVSPPTQTQTVT